MDITTILTSGALGLICTVTLAYMSLLIARAFVRELTGLLLEVSVLCQVLPKPLAPLKAGSLWQDRPFPLTATQEDDPLHREE